jgi:phosphoribosyl-dephospho-CoA transferase
MYIRREREIDRDRNRERKRQRQRRDYNIYTRENIVLLSFTLSASGCVSLQLLSYRLFGHWLHESLSG